MTQQELNAAVIAINKIIASNNPVAAVDALKKYGFQTKFDVLPAADIEKALLELYTANPSTYFQVIKEIPYRDTITNWTTSPETKQNIYNIASQLGVNQLNGNPSAKIDFGNIWHSIVTTIGGSSTTNPNVVTTTSQPLLSTTWIVILAIIGFAAIIFVLWDAGVFKRGSAA